ncbi:MAG: FKBP-type peptidyl-prolyl cis-trans isomerase [Candidatus Sumerlaeia bacterium]
MRKLLCPLMLCILLLGACSTNKPDSVSAPPEEAVELDNMRAKLSYCLGLDFGFRLRGYGVEVDEAALYEGLATGIAGEEPRLPQKEIQQIMREFTMGIQAKNQEAMELFGEKNLAAANEFLQRNRNEKGVKETESGLQYIILKEGKGKTPGPEDRIKVHYIGKTLEGKEFGNSYQKGRPSELDANRLIPGWAEAVQMMQEGSKWKLFIPPNLAYGEKGQLPHIQPNSMLIFEVELLEVMEKQDEAE